MAAELSMKISRPYLYELRQYERLEKLCRILFHLNGLKMISVQSTFGLAEQPKVIWCSIRRLKTAERIRRSGLVPCLGAESMSCLPTLVGSVPNFPYGTADNIEEITALGRKHNIPVHVDCCLGGFLTAFMPAAGFPVPNFDFALPGVVSLSVDPHKFGFTPKGASVVLYADKKYRHHQYTVTTDWPGGVYGSPTVNGSRSGGELMAWTVKEQMFSSFLQFITHSIEQNLSKNTDSVKMLPHPYPVIRPITREDTGMLKERRSDVTLGKGECEPISRQL
ncbi:Sphingosine-1-phosphate lyase 1 [Homalodisca vitripennis]|nr:Sphingosine-1-phosphate lyase 1 [Homalodisca vitripennis]